MATYENILKKIKRTDPEFARSIDIIERGVCSFYDALGIEQLVPVRVVMTEDMTEEEKELQIIEYYMNYEGVTIEEAEEKAKRIRAIMLGMFK